MKKNKGWYTLIGFFLVVSGFLSLALSLVGVKLAWLLWIDAAGASLGFLFRILMVLLGFVLVYLAQSNFRADMDEE